MDNYKKEFISTFSFVGESDIFIKHIICVLCLGPSIPTTPKYSNISPLRNRVSNMKIFYLSKFP